MGSSPITPTNHDAPPTYNGGMGIDYDAWLQQPYEEQAEWESLCEQYIESKQYADDLTEWLDEHPGETEEDYQESYAFENAVRSMADGFNDRHYDDRDYEERDRYRFNW